MSEKWIDVQDRLPEVEVLVLLYIERNYRNGNEYLEMVTGRYSDTYKTFFGNGILPVENVTHWQPLQKSPVSEV